ncbi:MAG: adenylate kinase [Candidatus Eisenbacteria bacterium]|nr:adenylate kinase [Candidatus Eisenbacteria bacterium]
MIIVFLGPPGSGKGTQAALLAVRRNWAHLSTGELLRAARTGGTPLGQKVAQYLDAGRLVPDELVTGLVVERVKPGPAGGYLLDGFPRNLAQAADLDQLARAAGHVVQAVVFFDVPEPELIRRLSGRARADDDPDTIRRRLRVYAEETSPLVDHYASRDLLRRVEGRGEIDAIHRRVLTALGERA